MKILGWELHKAIVQALPEEKQNQFESVIRQLLNLSGTGATIVTPENCEQSPTVKAIVTSITRRFAVTPIHVYQKSVSDGRETKQRLPDHPVAKLLAKPNKWQSRVDYWQDASSRLVRYGNFYAYKSRGSTGPIRELLPLNPADVSVKQDPKTWAVTYTRDGDQWTTAQMHHVRGPARDGVKGDSTVEDIQTAIALEMAAEKFGASFFQNGAMPLLVWTYMTGTQGFKDKEAEQQFVHDIQGAFSGGKAHRSMLVPKGIDKPTTIPIENDKSQFLETRKYQRTVIAGAWNVPPHKVGDLERATFNNVEQQDEDFTASVIMPYGVMFEAAMERDLLTDADRSGGIVIRFNFDSILRADFKSRQEGLRMQRESGIISPNEWREIEGRNPIEDKDGGDEYIRPANMMVAGSEPVPPKPGTEPKPKP